LVYLLGLALLACLSYTPATTAVGSETCLAPGDIQEVIAQGKVIEPKAAILTARQVVRGADVMRGGLCRQGEVLIYRILALRKDGRLVRIAIDASSGKVLHIDPP